MQVMLDTHALVWYLVAPNRLGGRACGALESADAGEATALIPAVVMAELIMIAEKRRIPGFALPELEHVYDAVCRHPNFRLLSLDVQTVWSARALNAIPDIFDRLLVAEARRIDAPILTCDRVICDSGLVQTIWD
jgi:PIN domain nuclease of toxin-antitoxin system